MSAATGVQRQTCGNCHGARVVGAFPCTVCEGLGQVAVASETSVPTDLAGVIALNAAECAALDEMFAAFGMPTTRAHDMRVLVRFRDRFAAARASEASAPDLLTESYSCGCQRLARWERCVEHDELEHDEEPERANASAPAEGLTKMEANKLLQRYAHLYYATTADTREWDEVRDDLIARLTLAPRPRTPEPDAASEDTALLDALDAEHAMHHRLLLEADILWYEGPPGMSYREALRKAIDARQRAAASEEG